MRIERWKRVPHPDREPNASAPLSAAARCLTQRLELATRAAHIGVWDWYVPHDRLIWDERMCALYGLAPDAFGGTFEDWAALLHPDDRERVLRGVRAALESLSEFSGEFAICLPDGKVRYMRAHAVIVRGDDGHPTRMTGVNFDITNQRHYETILQHALEQEKVVNDLKSRFLSMAAHEFRNPLAAILTSTELLVMHRARMTEAQIEDRLGSVRQSVTYLRDILDNVVQLSHIQAGRIEFNPILGDFEAACRDVVAEYDSLPEYSGRIRFEATDDTLLTLFDRRLVRYLVSSLVVNALKFSAPHTAVRVRVEEVDGYVRLSVADAGVGIPAGDLPHIFEPFYRAVNVSGVTGAGLGLSIARHAVALHGGQIAVESTPGIGTTVTVDLPIQSLIDDYAPVEETQPAQRPATFV